MRNIVLGLMMAALSLSAQASGQATIKCKGFVPTLNLTYSTGTDADKPGLFLVGVMSPDQQRGAFLDQSNEWEPYLGGLPVPQGVYRNGLPGSVTVSAAILADQNGMLPTTTADYVGWTIYAGHGVLTPQAEQRVARRRQVLDSVKAKRVAAGTWNSEYDSDDRFKWALVLQDTKNNKKYGPVLTIPMVDCMPGG